MDCKMVNLKRHILRRGFERNARGAFFFVEGAEAGVVLGAPDEVGEAAGK